MSGEGRPCVLLCVTGCIAAYKSCEVLRLLQKTGCRVKVLMTENATRFVGPATFRALTNEPVAVGLFDDPADPIHHISLAKEADLALVAPATANVIAKMAAGIADDLLSTTLLATKAPILVAPAMNTGMWTAAATQENLAVLRRRGVRFIEPDEGRLACGDVGAGKLAPVDQIARAALAALAPERSLAGERVLVTAGGTQEAIDPVRFIGNRSSGKFGYAIAEEAARRGAAVTLVSGPTALPAPAGVERVDVRSAAEMHDAVAARFEEATVLIAAAAVADYRPVSAADHKLKKTAEHLDAIELTETVDILAAMSARAGDRTVIGFAAETDDVVRHAQEKLARKGCDALVANDVSRSDSGFGTNDIAIFWVTDAGVEELPLMSKRAAAAEILTRVAELRRR
ncbi:MAG: bifunctional phosphopantothenoylcysteine decarboxylase/phosphopantothenate--cysteine ligase CoaBC [Collinsella sp.]|nr:bifunctional phosphopantothenoylcysteine decarboxylase/phosphopantothenate--cysteine ligase CoaBC [Collinsella sp.]